MTLHRYKISALLAAVAGLATLGRVLFFRPRTVGLSPDQVTPADRLRCGLVRVQFDLAEIPAIRQLVGSETATALLRAMAHKLQKLGWAVEPLAVSDSSLTSSFAATTAEKMAEQIIAAKAALAGATNVGGAVFNCRVRASIIEGDSDLLAGSRLSFERGTGSDCGNNGPAFGLTLLRDFQTGMANGNVALAYQPKLDLRAGAICSAEALLRWTRPDMQQINTGDLVALCEKIGTIKELTRWTIAKAIKDNERFLEAGHSLLVFVNVSGALLADGEFIDELLHMVSATPAQIGIEITETAEIGDHDIAISNLEKLANAGIAIAIDDFGAGLSSLEYLQRLPASELKIDRSFIAELSSSHRNPLITRATIDLAHALDMRVTAEGVDDELSMALLKIMGCDLVQGYLISRPLSPSAFIDFVRSFIADDEQKKSMIAAR